MCSELPPFAAMLLPGLPNVVLNDLRSEDGRVVRQHLDGPTSLRLQQLAPD
jgi:hypothetical protein